MASPARQRVDYPPLASHEAGMAWLAVLVLLSTDFALGKSLPWSLLPYHGGRWLWAAVSLAFAAVLFEQAGLIRLGALWARIGGRAVRFFGGRPGLMLLVLGNAV